MKEKLLKFIQENGRVTYCEIENFFDNCGYDYRGGLEIYSPVNDNVIFWTGWNEEAVKLLHSVVIAGQIKKDIANWIELMTGYDRWLSLPMVKRNVNYKEPHWLPVVFFDLKG